MIELVQCGRYRMADTAQYLSSEGIPSGVDFLAKQRNIRVANKAFSVDDGHVGFDKQGKEFSWTLDMFNK